MLKQFTLNPEQIDRARAFLYAFAIQTELLSPETQERINTIAQTLNNHLDTLKGIIQSDPKLSAAYDESLCRFLLERHLDKLAQEWIAQNS